MKVHIEDKAVEELANLLCEVDALIKDGTIPVGFTGISIDAAKYIDTFYKALTVPKETMEVYITDHGLNLI